MEKVAKGVCLQRRMKQALSDVVGGQKRAARQRMFSLFEYDLATGQAKDKDDTELTGELRNQLHEVTVKAGDRASEEWLTEWRMKDVGDIACSGSTVSARLKDP